MTANQIAAAFDIHPNVARHHLDRLLNEGFIRRSTRLVPTPTAGRPAKRYEVTEKSVSVQYSARKDERRAEGRTKGIAAREDGRE